MNCEFDEYSNPELIEAIEKWIHGKANREIMKLKIIDHETIESIAEKVDLSPITEDVNNKLKAGDGKIRSADSEYIKNLSKALYNVNVTVAMLEHENDERYSPEYSMGMGMRSRQDGNGGGTSRRERDRRGRFSGNDEAMDMADNIRRRMRDMPEDMRRSA